MRDRAATASMDLRILVIGSSSVFQIARAARSASRQ